MADLFSGKGGRNSAIAQRGIFADYYGRALGELTDSETDFGRAQQDQSKGYADANARYTSLADLANRGFSAYGDASGVNGAEGSKRAWDAFNASGYGQASDDYGIQRTQRAMSAGGNLLSGNTLTNLGEYLAAKRAERFGQFAAGQQGFGQMAAGFADRQALGDRSLADLSQSYAGLRSGLRGQRANIYTRQGDQIAGTAKQGFEAGDNAAANRWNIGMQGAKLAASLAGSYFGGGLK